MYEKRRLPLGYVKGTELYPEGTKVMVRMLEGDMAAVNAFRGEYMTNYSWAELTAGTLYFNTF